MGHPAFFIILILILVFVGGIMIQTGIGSLSGDGVSGFPGLTLSFEDIGVPAPRVRTPRDSSDGNSGGGNGGSNTQTTPRPEVDLPDWVKGNGISPYFGEVQSSILLCTSITSTPPVL